MSHTLGAVTQLKPFLSDALRRLQVPDLEKYIAFEHPAQVEFGDYSSNIAMVTFKQLPQETKEKLTITNPRQWAEKIADTLKDQIATYATTVSEVSIAGPGFINFRLSEQFLLEKNVILANGEYDLSELAHDQLSKQALVEYMQPNTNKPLHIGHLRNAILGSALINALESQNVAVKAATINNDRGLHIVKSMWSYLTHGKTPALTTPDQSKAHQDWRTLIADWQTQPAVWTQPQDMADERLHKADHFVGFWYVLADTFVEDEAVLKTWQEMLISWEQPEHPQHQQTRALWKQLNAWFYQGYAETQKLLTFHFDADQISYESEIYEAGRQIIIEAANRGIFQRLPDGAIKADLSSFDLPDKILLRRDGTGIYMTFDIELTRQRAAQGIKNLIWVVGSDQNLYFQQLFAVCELLGYGKRQDFKHFGYGMVRLPEGKMSSRKGTVVYADDVLELAITQASQVMAEAGVAADLSPQLKAQVAQQIGIGAVKWTMLSQDPMSNFTFDIETSLSFKGFAGPYVQYTFARCSSVLEKAITQHIDTLLDSKVDIDLFIKENADQSMNDVELSVSRWLYQFPEVVASTAAEYAPHKLCVYLYQLAQAFNAFYAAAPILHAENDRQTRQRRLIITAAVADVLKKGLGILGIEAVPKM